MPRSMVGLLATVGTAMSAVASLAHGDLFWAAVVDAAAAAAGLAAYLALPPTKKLIPRGTCRSPRCATCAAWVTGPVPRTNVAAAR
jgi:hypothetical protein